ncbi:MAG TPA: hypothetical protein VFL93_08705 [Longimicrobiaceae bacterium]|nr:hypothetical protein [Longimicrobiaceae bacterium]
MPNITRNGAEAAIVWVRAALIETLAHRHAYDEWAHNVCLAVVSLYDGGSWHREELMAYSHLSGLSNANLKKLYDVGGVEFVPDSIPFVGCNGMGRFHTEPRLLNYVLSRPGWIERVREITLISEINCCKTCRKYAIDEFRKRYPQIGLHTFELGMNPGENTFPKYRTIHG